MYEMQHKSEGQSPFLVVVLSRVAKNIIYMYMCIVCTCTCICAFIKGLHCSCSPPPRDMLSSLESISERGPGCFGKGAEVCCQVDMCKVGQGELSLDQNL